MEQNGLVKSTNGNTAKVAFIKKSGCGGGCSACKSGCPKDTVIIEVYNSLNAKIGDEVIVSMSSSKLSKMTFWAYIFPVIFTLLTLVSSIYILKNFNLPNYELYSAILSILSMMLSYKIGGILTKNKNDNYELEIVKVIRN